MTLSSDGELVLIRSAQTGDSHAAHELFSHYAAKIRSLAMRFQRSSLRAEDLEQEAWFPFFGAVMDFDPGRGASLWDLAGGRIRWHFIQEQSRWLGFSDDARKRFRRVRNTMADLEIQYRRSPTADEIAEKCDVRLATVNEIMAVLQGRDASLDDPDLSFLARQMMAKADTVDPSADVVRQLAAEHQFAGILRALGTPDGPKFLILSLLREEWELTWNLIAALLLDHRSSPYPGWESTLCSGYGRLSGLLPRTWADVYGLFQQGQPAVTPAALAQFQSRGSRRLAESYPWRTAGND